ncbi:MAG TPA: DivIVA domain-containing protein [Acidimicrobiales bacterium]|nr:DivIVA domain-containing protein [Acidimicrobiales bacterium]
MGPDPSLTPELIQAQSFTAGFRGYDQNEVRTFLGRVASEIRALRDRNANLESAWHSAEERAARPPVLDEDTLMSAVGEETAAILRTARQAAADLRARAAEDAERTLTDANARAEEINEEAQQVLGRHTQAADEAAARIVEGARSEAAGVLERARIEADTIRAKAEQERALTIEGANSTRDRILEDLSRRRRVATVQIEQLRAGRERLIESYAVVRRTLEEAQQELSRADAEARAAADEVGRRLRREHDLRPDEEHEVEPPAPFDTGASSAAGEAAVSGDSAPAQDTAAGESPPPREPDPSGPARMDAGGVEQAHTAGAPAGGGSHQATVEAAAPSTISTSGGPPARGGLRRRGPFGRGRGSNAVAVTAEHPAAMSNVARDPAVADAPSEGAPGSEAAGAEGPHLRLVPNEAGGGSGESEAPPAGSAVDELFARIRAGHAGGDSPEPSPDEVGGVPGEAAGPDVEAEATVPGTAQAEESSADSSSERALSDGDEALMQKREAAIVDLEVTLTRKLKRALQDEQNDLLDHLRSLRGEPTASALLPDHQAQIARYAAAASPLLAQASTAGAAFAADVLAVKAAGRTNASVGDLANETARSIVDALRRRVEEAISAHAGEDQSVLVESVGAAYREWKSQRIERIAGDALVAAFSRGTWNGTPDGTSMRWIVEDVDGPCPDCDDDALAGALARGEAFPTGQQYPPAHSGCRCLLVPTDA